MLDVWTGLTKIARSSRISRLFRGAGIITQSELDQLRHRADGYQAAFEDLQQQATEFRQNADGYRSAFETLQEQATQSRQEADGFRDAYEVCSHELAQVRDERDRILRSLERKASCRPSKPSGPNGRQLAFLHIYKTAGSSLQDALFEAMEDAPIFRDSLQNFDVVAPVEIAINDVVSGHFAYQHVAKLRPDRFLLTFLRDPTERVLSHYYFLRVSEPRSDYRARAIEASKSLSLAEFIRCDDPGVRMVTENFQAKVLAYDVRPEHQHGIANLEQEAAKNLAEFDFVGIVEHFDASVAALSEAIGIELAVKKSNINELRPSSQEVAAADIEIIRQLNRVDHALYTRARQQFERKFLTRNDARAVSI